MKLEYQLSNGNWTDGQSRTERILQNCQKFNNLTLDQVIDALKAGQELSTGNEWFEYCRDADAVKTADKTTEKIHCDCGHTIDRESVMSASMGTSCPDCYDKMSD